MLVVSVVTNKVIMRWCGSAKVAGGERAHVNECEAEVRQMRGDGAAGQQPRRPRTERNGHDREECTYVERKDR